MRTRLVVVTTMVVLMALIGVALNACGSQETNNKSESGGSADTNGQIAFRRYFNPDQTKGAIFTMNPDGSHIRQVTHPPRTCPRTMRRCGLPMGRGSPSNASPSILTEVES